eukprot:383416-Amphidinium_carterae.1
MESAPLATVAKTEYEVKKDPLTNAPLNATHLSKTFLAWTLHVGSVNVDQPPYNQQQPSPHSSVLMQPWDLS